MLLSTKVINSITRTEMEAYYDVGTKNKTFLDMHYYLKATHRKNNAFFLLLYNPNLAGVDPRDPNLSLQMKQAVITECRMNFWYFIREVIRIPSQGGEVGGGSMYRLDRGNLALNFGFLRNWNMFLELPRQFGKTISAICWYLWLFLFGTTNSEFMFINMKHEASKLNLKRLKEIREALPTYLQMSNYYDANNQKKKVVDRVETLEHPLNGNKIKTLAGATSKVGASGLGRGMTMPFHWYDEFAWIKFNSDIRLAATPSFSTASKNAKLNGAPYGILLTTTPGLMTTAEGRYAFRVRNDATPWQEEFYDEDPIVLEQKLALNTKSNFIHIIYTYSQLGKGDDYLTEMIKQLDNDYEAVRREVLLEWAEISDSCPFDRDDLDIIKGLVKDSDKCQIIRLAGLYKVYMYDTLTDRMYPPIIGVDVAGGFSHDSSAITIIDSKTTKVVGCMNCNYISIEHLAYCIYELVTTYMPNAIVNIERNGGFGASLIERLKNTSIKKNLYFEIKEDTIEERFDGIHTKKVKQIVKKFGTDNTPKVRGMLMELLKDRVAHHKDKFNSDIIYNEMKSMELKPNGRIEHSVTTHDDQVFSYLWALYVWYYGKNVMDNWGLYKGSIEYDSVKGQLDEVIIDESDKRVNVDYSADPNDTFSEQIAATAAEVERDMQTHMTYEQWLIMEKEMDNQATRNLYNNIVVSPLSQNKFETERAEHQFNDRITLSDDVYDMDYLEDENTGGEYEFNSIGKMYKSKNKEVMRM